jgi:arsenate reductase (glutaredoxin)
MQTLKLYGIPNCNTVKKARDWLESQQISYEFHDFKKQGVTPQLLENWLAQTPHEKLINRAGLTWRGLEDSIKSNIIDNASAIALMQAKTSVIKRPILEKNGKILYLGFDEIQYQALLA